MVNIMRRSLATEVDVPQVVRGIAGRWDPNPGARHIVKLSTFQGRWIDAKSEERASFPVLTAVMLCIRARL
jgi:hypothetical protein